MSIRDKSPTVHTRFFFVPDSLTEMADPMREKVRKLFESRSKAEAELRRIQQKVDDAVENKDRRVRVERLVSSCDEAMTNMFSKHELLFDLATKTEDPSLVKHDMETWLSEVTTQNFMVLKIAREYIDQCPSVDGASQSSTAATSKKQATKQNIKRKNVATIKNN